MRDALLDMRQAAAAVEAQLAVVLFPTEEEAYGDIARRYLAALNGIDPGRPPRLVSRLLADHAISVCDVTGELREQARRGHQLYHRVSGHLNDEGNRVAAAAIGRCLASANLLGARLR
jgi:hypothetical protein